MMLSSPASLHWCFDCKLFAAKAANFANDVTEWQQSVAGTATTERAPIYSLI
jgi:hypothetical protein